MIRYAAKRLGTTAAVVLLTLAFLGVLVHVVPGDPVKIILGPRATEALSELVREEMQLDEPVAVQVWNFVTSALRGDLGTDFASRLPVTEIIGSALPHTLILAVASLTLAVAVGIPTGYSPRRIRIASSTALWPFSRSRCLRSRLSSRDCSCSCSSPSSSAFWSLLLGFMGAEKRHQAHRVLIASTDP